MNKENNQYHPMNIQARNTNASRIQEDYITQVSEEIEGRRTKKFSQEFIWTESRILGALSRLDEFFRNPHPRVRPGTVLETSGNLSREKQGTNEDGSQHDPHPEVGVSLSHSAQELGPEETSYNTF